ncbi:MAG TPA: class I SAM-dependent methyltransferase, partial [Porphyromonadaceae bacterium]|nr:class I SAM-dependent methyltransferase [Porphyromonadaceae bacterium]
QKEDITVQPVVCCEYSADIQKHILHLQLEELPEPILDVGSGKHGNLVKSLRAAGLIVYGIDRFSDCSWVEKADWLTYDYGMEKWGTIISNLGFSNHFLHHHLREDGNFIGYAKKYMEILNSLKLHGRMYYAPELPFIEQYLDKN